MLTEKMKMQQIERDVYLRNHELDAMARERLVTDQIQLNLWRAIDFILRTRSWKASPRYDGVFDVPHPIELIALAIAAADLLE